MKQRILFAATLLAAASAWAATDVQGPSGLLKGQVPDDLPALKRVAIGGFWVQYVTDFGVETKRSRGGTFFSKWRGVEPAQLQAASNALYAQLVADLQAAGIEVVPAAEVAAAPALAELRGVAKPGPQVINDSSLRKVSTVVAALELPISYAVLPDVKLDRYATAPVEGTDAPGQLMGWDEQVKQWLAPANAEMSSLATIYFGQAKLAQSLRATVVNVRVTLPLVDLGVTTAGNAGGGLFGSAKVTGVIKANPRLVEAGTVFSFVQPGGNPGHRHLVGLQRPVPVAGLGVRPEPEQVALDDTLFGKQSARGSGLLGLFSRSSGGNTEGADFWVQVDGAGLQAALVQAASPVFKELGAILANPK
jgi:hypothetical protein